MQPIRPDGSTTGATASGSSPDRDQVDGSGLEDERLAALERAPGAGELDDAADRDDRPEPRRRSRQAASIANDPGRPRSSHSQVRGEPEHLARPARRSALRSSPAAVPARRRENSSSAPVTSALSCSDWSSTVFCSATEAR